MVKRNPANRKQSDQRIDDALRQTVEESGLTVYRICKVAGITIDSLYRFLSGERDLRFSRYSIRSMFANSYGSFLFAVRP